MEVPSQAATSPGGSHRKNVGVAKAGCVPRARGKERQQWIKLGAAPHAG